MSSNRELFADRLDVSTYADDPKIRWFSSDPPLTTWVPERLVERLRLLGGAYQLHLLLHLPRDGDEPLSLNGTQVAHLIEEVDFVAGVAADPARRSTAWTASRDAPGSRAW